MAFDLVDIIDDAELSHFLETHEYEQDLVLMVDDAVVHQAKVATNFRIDRKLD
jgi:hypothetical protein